MCRILSISGSHGVGKTSLVDLITKNLLPPYKLKIFREINSGLYKTGFCLNGKAEDFDELMFSQEKAFFLLYDTIKYYLSRTHDNRLIVMDRSCVDTYIYTKFFLKQQSDIIQRSPKYSFLIIEMENKSKEILSLIDHVLLAPFSNFEVHEDRMTLNDRDVIWNMFTKYFTLSKSNKFKILQSNTLGERYNELEKHYL